MAKPSRWNAEKRYQIVKEALSQKEPMGQELQAQGRTALCFNNLGNVLPRDRVFRP
jgi:hypothetical protein